MRNGAAYKDCAVFSYVSIVNFSYTKYFNVAVGYNKHENLYTVLATKYVTPCFKEELYGS